VSANLRDEHGGLQAEENNTYLKGNKIDFRSMAINLLLNMYYTLRCKVQFEYRILRNKELLLFTRRPNYTLDPWERGSFPRDKAADV